MKLLDLVNQRFGRLVVVRRGASTCRGETRWVCRCDCGREKLVLSNSLRRGLTSSCGSHPPTTHGMSSTKAYKTWERIWQRTTNPKAKGYQNYGGRGIRVCRRWRRFENFHADMGDPPAPHLTIERKNNNGNYCRSNCRWATTAEQNINSRRNRRISYNGKTQTVMEWCRELGFNYSTIKFRLDVMLWTVERALSTPPEYHRPPHSGQ